MRFAVGAYSGPRAVCGAVAQLANNAIHVVPAIRRMDALVSSSFISVGNVHTLGRCCGGKYDECTAFAKQTLVAKRQNEITAFSSSTKSAEIRRTASAMRSCTVENRRNLNGSSIGLN